jgi:cysteine desulfurase
VRASRVYLDYCATAPLRPQARAAMLAALELAGNPSSVHADGRAARAALETARASIAQGIGAKARNLVFTSSATEAANLALTPQLQLARDPRPFDVLLLSGGEHACVRTGHRFPQQAVETLPLTPQGELSLEKLAAALKRQAGRKVVLALQAANNETGVIQPVARAAALLRACGGLVVCDATQAVGRSDATFATLGADVLLLSSHKLGGPTGAGALAFAGDDLHINDVMLRGGGQEAGRRAGTENIAAAVGFAAALEAALAEGSSEKERLAALRDAAERRAGEILPEVEILGAGAPRLAHVSAMVFPSIPAQTLAIALDLEGVAVSAGSACSSGKLSPSAVLAAMGRTEPAALRISLGWSSGAQDVDYLGAALAKVVARMKSRRPAA